MPPFRGGGRAWRAEIRLLRAARAKQGLPPGAGLVIYNRKIKRNGKPVGFKRAYGLCISSDLDLPELNDAAGPAQVFIRLGPTPSQLENPVTKTPRLQAAPGRFLLDIEGVARYFVQEGREITLTPAPGVQEVDVRLYLLGSALGALMHQRAMLPLHGAALARGQEAFFITGVSGAGKSTLAHRLIERGLKYLSDDVCAVSFDPAGRPLLTPSFPRLKLWGDSLTALGLSPEGLPKVASEMDKYHLRLAESFCDETLPLTCICLIDPHGQSFQAEEITGARKVGALLANTYRVRFLEGLGGKKNHFRQLTGLAPHVRMFRLSRPEQGFRVDELADLVFEALGPVRAAV